MQCTTDLHDDVPYYPFKESDGVLDNQASLDTADNMLNAHPKLGDLPIGFLLLGRELPTSGFLLGHDDFYPLELVGKESQILQKIAPLGLRT